MAESIAFALSAIFAYMLGSVPTAYLVGRLARGIDIRKVGSGNVGALNTFHQVGPEAAVAVLVADTLKGVLAILASMLLSDSPWICVYGAVGVLAGHNWPLFLGFRGGKGAATALGVSLVVQPWLTLATLVPALVLGLLSRNVVLAAAFGFLLLNTLVVATGQGWVQILLCLVLTLVVVATYFGRSWRETVASIRHGRLLDLFSFE